MSVRDNIFHGSVIVSVDVPDPSTDTLASSIGPEVPKSIRTRGSVRNRSVTDMGV